MNRASKLICEFVGTFALCYIGGAGVISAKAAGASEGMTLLIAALAHGLILFVAVAATINVSGAYFNPAVTITMWFNKRIDGRGAIAFLIVQFAAALAAGGLLDLMAIYGGSSDAWTEAANAMALGNPTFDTGHLALPAVIGIEMMLTFILVFVIWGAAVDPRNGRHSGALAIGLVVAANILAAGSITGASMNPARSFGPGFIAYVMPGDYLPHFWTMQVAYFIGPILGALAAGIIYEKFILPPDEGRSPV